MEKKIIGQGAEAIISLKKENVIKERVQKRYRHPGLDEKLIKRRTKAETKIMIKSSEIIPTPKPKNQEKTNIIEMPFIEGEKLSEFLDSYSQKKQEKIMFQIGESMAKLHSLGIIHGDLTTSNLIFSPSKKKVYFIDFGLAFQNGKYEDKGVDIHLLKQALEAKHFKNWKFLFDEFKKGYSSIKPEEAEKVFKRMEAIEKRGRYRH